jgi:hypothetical protein
LSSTESLSGNPSREDTAQVLVEAFYRGIGADASVVTLSMRKRDLAIARQLVAVGASPSDAETYAGEMIAISTRVAPVDLRSFERERLSWLAQRRRRDRDERHFVDRTGQPPSWEIERLPHVVEIPAGSGSGEAQSAGRTVFDARSRRLRDALQSALIRQNG